MFLAPETHRLRDGGVVTLRSGAEQDAAKLLAAIRGYLRQNDGLVWEPDEQQQTESELRVWIVGMLKNDRELLLLAELDGEIVGNIDFHIGSRRRLRHSGEFGLAVAAAHRRRGIGRLLLGRMIAWARSVPQIERIGLRAIATNASAIALYEEFGFVREGLRGRQIKYADGSYADDLLMGLLIERH
ncbi:MAG TPA: GNAT family protein [Methylocystis sp.]|nr:GNAT family protein [Methylocystis sp.]